MTSPGSTELVIFAGPSGDLGDAIRGALAEWARAELLRPVYWVSPQEQSEGVVSAHRLDHGGAVSVRLPEDLGTTVWERCRFLVVQPVTPRAPGTAELVAWAATYSDFLARSVLPMGTPLLRVNLLIPTSDTRSISQTLLVDGWEETVLASPEQRASTDHPNVLVAEGQNLVGHAALTAASAAGIWQGMRGTPLDSLSAESGSGQPAPRIMRSFVRALLGGEVTQLLADRCLTPTETGWRVPDSDIRQLGAAPDPRGLIDDLVSQLDVIDSGALVYGAPPTALVPERVRVGWRVIWSTFKEFWSLMLRRMGDIPSRMTAATDQRISSTLFGKQGAHEFGFGVDDVQARVTQIVELKVAGETADGSIFGQVRLAGKALELLGHELRPEAARAQAWVELRQLCLSVVDGGAMPSEMEIPFTGAGRPVITNPKLVVPNSEDPRFAVPDDICKAHESLAPYQSVVLPPCDPLLTARLDRDLCIVRDDFALRALDERALAGAKEAETAVLRESAAGWKEDEGRAELEAQAMGVERDGAQASGRAELLEVWANRLTVVEEELTDWAEPRSGTLFWRVGETLGRNLDQAEIDRQGALAAGSTTAELDVATLDRARKRVVWTLMFAAAAGIAAGAIGLFHFDLVWTPVVAAAAVLVIFCLAFIRYTRLKSETEWRFTELTADHLNALNMLLHTAREVSRLSTLYQLFIDWAEILGYQVHVPWIADAEALAPAPVVSVDANSLPPSLLVGSCEVGEENLTFLSARAAREIQREGWLGDSFQAGREFSMRRLANQEGRAVEALDPDRDSPTESSGARAFLLEDLRAHRPQQHAYRTAVDGMASFCADLEPYKLFQAVALPDGGQRDVDAFLAEIVPAQAAAVPGFLIDLMSPAGRVKRLHEQVSSYVWAPTGIGDHEGVVNVSSPTTRAGQYLLQAVRLDIGPALDTNDFSIFEGATQAPRTPAVAGEGDKW